MKRIFYTTLLLLISFSFFYFKDNKIDTVCIIKNTDKINIFVYENDLLIGVVGEVKGDKIIDAFNYLTINSNALRINTKTYVNYDSILLDYKIEDDSIILNFNDYILDSNNLALEQIFLTYNVLGFNKVFIKINGNKIDYFNNICIKEGFYDGLINLKMLSNDIIISKRIIIYNYLDNDEIIRYDYIVDDDVNKLDFIKEYVKIDFYIDNNLIKVSNDYSDNHKKVLELTLKSNMLNYNIISNE